MQVIDMARLLRDEPVLSQQFQRQQPFKYIVIDDFLHLDQAHKIFKEYPAIDDTWGSANGLHTRGKWAKPAVASSIAESFYDEINSPEFRQYLARLTGIDDLLADADLQGAGYHQILDGGFLNVHIDFNRLDRSALDRRLNLIVYMNPEWTQEYGGYLELWDMQTKTRVGNIAPIMNRCVIFETNEVSYHGHPEPLNTGGKATRKSLSVYYYTDGRDDIEAADTHNTVYVNTQGAEGATRILRNGILHAGRKLGAKLFK